jgi:hypothetical protein
MSSDKIKKGSSKQEESGRSKMQKKLAMMRKAKIKSTSSKGMATVKANY